MEKQPKSQDCGQSTNDDVFADYEPPRTTDGSYRGTMKKVKATEEHLQRKFDEAFVKTTTRLKEAKTRVGLKVTGGSIQLQATLPPKPGSDKVKPYQQLVSLGIPANLDGLKTAEEEANELGRLLARKQFDWSEKYLGRKQEEIKVLTMAEMLQEFEEKYYKTRPRTINSNTTFGNYKSKLLRTFLPDDNFDQMTIEKRVNSISSQSSKKAIIKSLLVLSKTFGLTIDVGNLKVLNYEKKEKNIPSDDEIVRYFGSFTKYNNERQRKPAFLYSESWQLFQWCYGMLATFGLRPRELFLNPDIEWWLSPENVDDTWKVHKDCKTGAREAFPLHQDWVMLFDLKNSKYLLLLKQFVKDRDKHTDFQHCVTINASWFRRVGLKFDPYSLRHAWAIRAHLMGIPIKVAADNLGHSIDEHTRTYQRWFGRENRKNAINAAVAKKSEVELLKDEVAKLTLENERLKIENSRLRFVNDNPKMSTL